MDSSRYFISASSFEAPEPLLDCDIELIKASHFLMIDAVDNGNKGQATQIAQTIIDYLDNYNKAFLASERTRHLLLLSLFATSLIALVGIIFIPFASVGITLTVLLAVTLFAINIGTSVIQSNHHQQQHDLDRLKDICTQSESEHPRKKTNLFRLSDGSGSELTCERTPENPQRFKSLFTSTPKKTDPEKSRDDNELSYQSVTSHLNELSHFSR